MSGKDRTRMHHDSEQPGEYVIGDVREALAEDPRVNQLDLQVALAGGRVFVSGEVPTAERKEAVGEVSRERAREYGYDVCNETRVRAMGAPQEAEELS